MDEYWPPSEKPGEISDANGRLILVGFKVRVSEAGREALSKVFIRSPMLQNAPNFRGIVIKIDYEKKTVYIHPTDLEGILTDKTGGKIEPVSESMMMNFEPKYLIVE